MQLMLLFPDPTVTERTKQCRHRRAGVEDLWRKTVRDADGNLQVVSSERDGNGKRWRARYVDDEGREQTKAFTRKADAQSMAGQRDHPEAGHRHLRRTRGRAGDRGRGVRVVVGVARPHLGQDGRDPAQRMGQPGRAALGRRGGGRREDLGRARHGWRRWSPTASVRRRSRTLSVCCARCSARPWRTSASRATRARV